MRSVDMYDIRQLRDEIKSLELRIKALEDGNKHYMSGPYPVIREDYGYKYTVCGICGQIWNGHHYCIGDVK